VELTIKRPLSQLSYSMLQLEIFSARTSSIKHSIIIVSYKSIALAELLR